MAKRERSIKQEQNMNNKAKNKRKQTILNNSNSTYQLMKLRLEELKPHYPNDYMSLDVGRIDSQRDQHFTFNSKDIAQKINMPQQRTRIIKRKDLQSNSISYRDRKKSIEYDSIQTLSARNTPQKYPHKNIQQNNISSDIKSQDYFNEHIVPYSSKTIDCKSSQCSQRKKVKKPNLQREKTEERLRSLSSHQLDLRCCSRGSPKKLENLRSCSQCTSHFKLDEFELEEEKQKIQCILNVSDSTLNYDIYTDSEISSENRIISQYIQKFQKYVAFTVKTNNLYLQKELIDIDSKIQTHQDHLEFYSRQEQRYKTLSIKLQSPFYVNNLSIQSDETKKNITTIKKQINKLLHNRGLSRYSKEISISQKIAQLQKKIILESNIMKENQQKLRHLNQIENQLKNQINLDQLQIESIKVARFCQNDILQNEKEIQKQEGNNLQYKVSEFLQNTDLQQYGINQQSDQDDKEYNNDNSQSNYNSIIQQIKINKQKFEEEKRNNATLQQTNAQLSQNSQQFIFKEQQKEKGDQSFESGRKINLNNTMSDMKKKPCPQNILRPVFSQNRQYNKIKQRATSVTLDQDVQSILTERNRQVISQKNNFSPRIFTYDTLKNNKQNAENIIDFDNENDQSMRKDYSILSCSSSRAKNKLKQISMLSPNQQINKKTFRQKTEDKSFNMYNTTIYHSSNKKSNYLEKSSSSQRSKQQNQYIHNQNSQINNQSQLNQSPNQEFHNQDQKIHYQNFLNRRSSQNNRNHNNIINSIRIDIETPQKKVNLDKENSQKSNVSNFEIKIPTLHHQNQRPYFKSSIQKVSPYIKNHFIANTNKMLKKQDNQIQNLKDYLIQMQCQIKEERLQQSQSIQNELIILEKIKNECNLQNQKCTQLGELLEKQDSLINELS